MVHPKDTTPQGPPETVVDVPSGSVVGLYIKGVPGQVMLGISQDRDGQPVSCAITQQLPLDLSRIQRNPNRLKHGSTEDDGA